jgi:drug/metabolite transporter (DMT)-like permease
VLIGLSAALAAATAFGVAAVLQAVAARREPPVRGVDPLLLVRLLRHRSFVAALALNLLGFGLHVAALRTLPLFLTQAVIASSVVVTAVVGAHVLNVPPRAVEYAAVLGVCVGLGLLAATASPAGTTPTDPALRGALLPGAALVGAAGLVAARLPGPLGASVLGLVAGLGFALVAVAGRVLPDLAPAALLREPAAYALLAGGAVAYLLYAIALQRAAVMTATSTLVLAQTVVPAAVGVLALGDTVRAGGALLAALGLALAVAGAGALARYDPYVMAGGVGTPD